MIVEIDTSGVHAWIDVEKFDDESDIDEAFSRLTGVNHKKPVVKLQHQYQPRQIEGYYGGQCYYEQLDYEEDDSE